MTRCVSPRFTIMIYVFFFNLSFAGLWLCHIGILQLRRVAKLLNYNCFHRHTSVERFSSISNSARISEQRHANFAKLSSSSIAWQLSVTILFLRQRYSKKVAVVTRINYCPSFSLWDFWKRLKANLTSIESRIFPSTSRLLRERW